MPQVSDDADAAEDLHHQLHELAADIDRELGQLRQLLNKTSFGSAAHVAQMLKQPAPKLTAAA
jgi:hypothetical protein